MQILYMGCKERGERCLAKLLDNNEDIIAVITDPDQEGKDKDPVKSLAEKNKIPVFQPKNINSDESIEKIKELDPDLIILVSYNQIIKKALIDIPSKGIINLHGGKLPEYRGSSPINWQIINGEKEAGICVIYVNEGIDEGDILAQKRFEIRDNDTVKEVTEKIINLFPDLLYGVVQQIKNGKEKPIKQDLSKGKYYGSRRPEDGLLNFKLMNSEEIYNFIRALTHPLPGAFTFHNGKKLFIWEAKLLNKDYIHTPGKVFLKREGGVVVMTKDKGILIKKIQIEGKEEIDAKDYFKKIGDYLE